MSERVVHVPKESAGTAPGRGRLDRRRVLVVGGGQQDIGEPDTPIGNGRTIAVLCAREGARVAVADRDAKSAAETVEMMDKGRGLSIQADVTKEADIARMVKDAIAGFGGLDGLVLMSA
jgi:NAD(P)-dependent dehydrogenase (short-subunit alcohol dehydrogenase family)